jgi:hypothetical protein
MICISWYDRRFLSLSVRDGFDREPDLTVVVLTSSHLPSSLQDDFEDTASPSPLPPRAERRSVLRRRKGPPDLNRCEL